MVLLEKDKFPITTNQAIKFAHDLKNVINTTHPLHGSDILISYRLVYHLISHELSQKGLTMSHKQDRYFLHDLMFVTNEILDLSHLKYWDRMNQMMQEGGPDQFLSLFNDYAKVLIENQEDTFTDPFEIALKNIIFGMDVVSPDDLWGIVPSKNSDSTSSDENLIHSIYLEPGLHPDYGLSISLPKYNNYPRRKHHIDDVTKMILPLNLIGIKPTDTNHTHSGKFLNHRGGGISSMTREHPSKSIYSYIIFSTIGHLLPTNYDSSIRNRFGVPVKLNSPLYSVAIKPSGSSPNDSRPMFLNRNLKPKITFRFRMISTNGFNNPQCGYWIYGSPSKLSTSTSSFSPTLSKDSKNSQHRGKWSSRGCEVTGIYPSVKLRKSFSYVNCTCDRIGAFGVLMDMTASKIYFEESLLLNISTLAGTSISLIILLVTLIIFSVIRGVQTNSNSIHRNIVICMFFTQIFYTIAMELRNSLSQKGFSCTLMAIFLHYFYLSQFSWLFVESIHLYRMLTEIRDINHGPMRFYYSLGYALPAIIVGLTVGVRADQYGHYLFCWLSINEGIIWSMLIPIALSMIASIVIFIYSLKASVQIKETISDYGNLKTLLWLSMILLPLLGASWIFSLMASNDTVEELNYSSILLSILSSFYVFVGYCLVNKRVRYNIKITWYRLKGMKITHLEESISGTRASLASRTLTAVHNPNFDILNSRGFGISTASTTSRSTGTGTRTSSSPYRSDVMAGSSPHCTGAGVGIDDGMVVIPNRYPRRHKKHLRRHHHRYPISESESEVYSRSMDLASSHSSDEEEVNTSIDTPEQNQINTLREQSLIEEPHEVEEEVTNDTVGIPPIGQVNYEPCSDNLDLDRDVPRFTV